MPRDRQHLILNVLSKTERFKPKGQPKTRRPSDVANRAEHAEALLRALDYLPDLKLEQRPGIYLEVEGRRGEPMVHAGLNASNLKLLRRTPAMEDRPGKAVVYATGDGLTKLRKKISDFAEKNRKQPDGSEGRPFNADLVQSINSIVEAGLRSLWRSPAHKFPEGQAAAHWEVWITKEKAPAFLAAATGLGLKIGAERLEFPEDIVVVAHATPSVLALAVRRLDGVIALASPSVTADHFDSLPPEEQGGWVAELRQRTTFEQLEDPNYVTLLDRGVSRAHPLIAPALRLDDRYSAEPSWSVEDFDGHGTQLAGLSLFGDLSVALQTMLPIKISHRLESAKIIPDAGFNPHHLLGAVTRGAINAVETSGDRRRTFVLASTTEDDTPHDGAPTSWSSEVDQLSAGVSGLVKKPRLILVSAGNSDQNKFRGGNYLDICDHPDNEIESPAQSWNAICVGAYTEKTTVPAGEPGVPLAALGDISPSSRTASWSSHWPLKPDVVMEGGNWLVHGLPPPFKHSALSLLTTDHQYPKRAFTTTGDTSGATALAARAITQLWSDYPTLWPETVRALFVSSARWTERMRSHLPASPNKSKFAQLFKRYGYGVPDLDRARRSAANAITLVVQDTLTPYRRSGIVGADHVHNEMKLFELPWPTQELRKLINLPVTLRVALSTFIAPNPSEPARGSKFRYASHNLRFKLNRANESRSVFISRISKVAGQPDESSIEEDDGWTFGRNRRDVGSLHVDELTCPASDLARRNILAVHPVSGWWKTKTVANPEELKIRFALIVEIDAGEAETDLYAEVQAAVRALSVAQITA